MRGRGGADGEGFPERGMRGFRVRGGEERGGRGGFRGGRGGAATAAPAEGTTDEPTTAPSTAPASQPDAEAQPTAAAPTGEFRGRGRGRGERGRGVRGRGRGAAFREDGGAGHSQPAEESKEGHEQKTAAAASATPAAPKEKKAVDFDKALTEEGPKKTQKKAPAPEPKKEAGMYAELLAGPEVAAKRAAEIRAGKKSARGPRP